MQINHIHVENYKTYLNLDLDISVKNEENTPKHLQGGIIIHDINHSGNWLYSPQPIDNTYDTQGWDAFFPDMYK